MVSYLFINEGPRKMAVGEAEAFKIDCANVSGAETVSDQEVTEVVNLATGEDEMEDAMPSGSATVSGTVITLPAFHALAEGTYRIQFSFQAGGNTFIRNINVEVYL